MIKNIKHKLNIREFEPNRDTSAICKIDASFTTNFIYEMKVQQNSLSLKPVHVSQPQTKKFLIDLKDNHWKHGYVAIEDGIIKGFIATNFEAWNHRLVIWHFYVDNPYRGKGIGRLLLEYAIESGRQLGAITAWIETSNLNYPGIKAYRHLGFNLCGCDLTLYKGTKCKNEFAVYMARSISKK